MDEFGSALGFEGKACRYELPNTKLVCSCSKAGHAVKIAEVLQCNNIALDVYSLSTAEDIIETLFC